ncbi:hypothetical protein WA158_002763, partial [Blastocystis sp. Blastoise]
MLKNIKKQLEDINEQCLVYKNDILRKEYEYKELTIEYERCKLKNNTIEKQLKKYERDNQFYNANDPDHLVSKHDYDELYKEIQKKENELNDYRQQRIRLHQQKDNYYDQLIYYTDQIKELTEQLTKTEVGKWEIAREKVDAQREAKRLMTDIEIEKEINTKLQLPLFRIQRVSEEVEMGKEKQALSTILEEVNRA